MTVVFNQLQQRGHLFGSSRTLKLYPRPRLSTNKAIHTPSEACNSWKLCPDSLPGRPFAVSALELIAREVGISKGEVTPKPAQWLETQEHGGFCPKVHRYKALLLHQTNLEDERIKKVCIEPTTTYGYLSSICEI